MKRLRHNGTHDPPNPTALTSAPKPIRCAIYTRKSTEEGLQQEFNSLDHQRESAEAFIKSQAHEGWTCLAQRYDDGGFTGGNMDRPALKRLLADIDSGGGGGIDCVVVYKVDRLSRSLLDFAKMMELFDNRKVSFVAVTQQINTSTSMGRLMLNVLLSFAQFERELVSERTRDKIAAARRKGKWAGGHPLLGYDVVKSPGGSKLVINEDEAQRVRQIFDLYIERKGLIPAVTEVNFRGWATKHWVTTKGTHRGGRPFDKYTLFVLLKNLTYLGKVKHKQQVYDGEHPAIVDRKTFKRAQDLLRLNGRGGGAGVLPRKKLEGPLLRGLMRCKPCGCSMGPTYASKGNVRYRYYVCLNATKRGWNICQSKSVPAHQIEQIVVERIRAVAKAADRRLISDAQTLDDLRALGPGWDKLPLREQANVLRRMVQQVDYDGDKCRVAITFRCEGIGAPSQSKDEAA